MFQPTKHTVKESPVLFSPKSKYADLSDSSPTLSMEVLLTVDAPSDASSVFVAGTFNGWKEHAIPLVYVCFLKEKN